MTAELGHYALVLALALALVQSIIPIWGAQTRDVKLMAMAAPMAIGQFLFTALAFSALTYAYIRSDFSILNVWQNSYSQKPLLYKVTGVWGNHEGSMLLWVLILALFGAAIAVFGRNLPAALRANVLAVQAWVGAAFFLFILMTSNPFARLNPAPFQGRDLNPILQDIGLALHPPLLYLGYVGFSTCFSFAVAALIDGRIDAIWARWVRPWTLAAWMFLTLGIAMGSYWAYYELGWGGWWFWDPVENASFMPWLLGTALLHSAIVMEKRNALSIWTILLAILTFSLSLLGTFLVRSGVLTSVHAFATDPSRGVFILAILVIFIGGALALFAWRAPQIRSGGLFAPISREGALIFNNLFLSAACAAVLIGTLYPLFLDVVSGQKISVGAPFFNATFGPLMIPLLIAIPFGPFLAWKRGDILGAAQRLLLAFILALIIGMAVFAMTTRGPLLAPLGIGLAVWLMMGALSEPLYRIKLFRAPIRESLRRAVGLPRQAWGVAFAHFGVGVTLLGIVSVSSFESENVRIMYPGDSAEIGGYQLEYIDLKENKGPNYSETIARFAVKENGKVIAEMMPSKRFYTARGMPTTEAAIQTFGLHQIYIAPGDIQKDESEEANGEGNGRTQKGEGLAVRLYDKPLVTLIWLGCVLMVLGGLASLSDRRLRIGVPKAARKRSIPDKGEESLAT